MRIKMIVMFTALLGAIFCSSLRADDFPGCQLCTSYNCFEGAGRGWYAAYECFSAGMEGGGGYTCQTGMGPCPQSCTITGICAGGPTNPNPDPLTPGYWGRIGVYSGGGSFSGMAVPTSDPSHMWQSMTSAAQTVASAAQLRAGALWYAMGDNGDYSFSYVFNGVTTVNFHLKVEVGGNMYVTVCDGTNTSTVYMSPVKMAVLPLGNLVVVVSKTGTTDNSDYTTSVVNELDLGAQAPPLEGVCLP